MNVEGSPDGSSMIDARAAVFTSVYCFVSVFAIFASWNFFCYRTLSLEVYENGISEKYKRDYCLPLKCDAATDIFLPVNRTSKYLSSEAYEFAKMHNVADSVLSLYEKDEQAILRNTRSNKKRSKSRTKRKYSIFSGWNGRKINPCFVLPIDKKFFWLSSPFGKRKKVDGTQGFHHGIDMASPYGTSVKAVGNGVVIQAEYVKGYGNVVVISHDRRYKTRYAHLSSILVRVGQRVRSGKIIGKVGATGYVRKSGKDASHLHFEVEIDGKRMNPICFFK